MRDRLNILIVADLHGLTKWKDIDSRNWDKIIFLGDYVDSFTIDGIHILSNLNDLIEFKKQNMDKVVLLIGNHDNSYNLIHDHKAIVNNISFGCSGFNEKMSYSYKKLYMENETLFQATYQVDNYLFSHAGLSKWDYKTNYKREHEYHYSEMTLSEYLNMLYEKRDPRLFVIGHRRGGANKFGSIFWADYIETSDSILDNYHQVVGHSPIPQLTTVVNKEKNGSVTYCDTLEHYKGLFYNLIINLKDKNSVV